MPIDQTTVDIPKEPAKRRAWVIYQLRIRGRSLRQLAEKNGVSSQAMSQALIVPSAHLELVIAKALGTRVELLFPERFDAVTGERIPRTRPPERTSRAPLRNAKDEEAT